MTEAITTNNFVKNHLKGDHYPTLFPRRGGGGGGGVYADIRLATESVQDQYCARIPRLLYPTFGRW